MKAVIGFDVEEVMAAAAANAAVRAGPGLTGKSVGAEYAGEHNKAGWHSLDPKQAESTRLRTRMHSEEERAAHTLDQGADGRFTRRDGTAINTGEKMPYVMDARTGEMVAFEDSVRGVRPDGTSFENATVRETIKSVDDERRRRMKTTIEYGHHSSALGGDVELDADGLPRLGPDGRPLFKSRQAASAGSVRFDHKGRLNLISNESGHYKPGIDMLMQAIEHLMRNGAFASGKLADAHGRPVKADSPAGRLGTALERQMAELPAMEARIEALTASLGGEQSAQGDAAERELAAIRAKIEAINSARATLDGLGVAPDGKLRAVTAEMVVVPSGKDKTITGLEMRMAPTRKVDAEAFLRTGGGSNEQALAKGAMLDEIRADASGRRAAADRDALEGQGARAIPGDDEVAAALAALTALDAPTQLDGDDSGSGMSPPVGRGDGAGEAGLYGADQPAFDGDSLDALSYDPRANDDRLGAVGSIAGGEGYRVWRTDGRNNAPDAIEDDASIDIAASADVYTPVNVETPAATSASAAEQPAADPMVVTYDTIPPGRLDRAEDASATAEAATDRAAADPGDNTYDTIPRAALDSAEGASAPSDGAASVPGVFTYDTIPGAAPDSAKAASAPSDRAASVPGDNTYDTIPGEALDGAEVVSAPSDRTASTLGVFTYQTIPRDRSASTEADGPANAAPTGSGADGDGHLYDSIPADTGANVETYRPGRTDASSGQDAVDVALGAEVYTPVDDETDATRDASPAQASADRPVSSATPANYADYALEQAAARSGGAASSGTGGEAASLVHPAGGSDRGTVPSDSSGQASPDDADATADPDTVAAIDADAPPMPGQGAPGSPEWTALRDRLNWLMLKMPDADGSEAERNRMASMLTEAIDAHGRHDRSAWDRVDALGQLMTAAADAARTAVGPLLAVQKALNEARKAADDALTARAATEREAGDEDKANRIAGDQAQLEAELAKIGAKLAKRVKEIKVAAPVDRSDVVMNAVKNVRLAVNQLFWVADESGEKMLPASIVDTLEAAADKLEDSLATV